MSRRVDGTFGPPEPLEDFSIRVYTGSNLKAEEPELKFEKSAGLGHERRSGK
jgi:hypothetical protein